MMIGILSSCATSSKKIDNGNNNVVVDPTDIINPPIEIDNDKFAPKLKEVRNSKRYKAFLKEGNSSSQDISNLNYHKGLDKLITYGLLNPSSPGERRIAFIGHRVQHQFLSSIATMTFGKDSIFNCLKGECTNATEQQQQYFGGSSNQTLSFLILPLNTNPEGSANDNNAYFGIGSNGPGVNLYMIESSSNETYNIDNLTTAIKKATSQKAYTLLYDFADGLRYKNSYKWVTGLDNSSILSSSGVVSEISKLEEISSELKTFLSSSPNTTIVMPTGTLTKYGQDRLTNLFVNSYNPLAYQLSYGVFGLTESKKVVFTDGLLTGNLVQILQSSNQVSANENSIALSVPVFSNGEKDKKGDFIYNPDKKAILPGTLRDYSFAVAVREGFGASPETPTSGATFSGSAADSYKVSEGRFANITLGGAINIIAQYSGDERKAISLLKTNYTIKKYAPTQVSNLTSTNYETGKFYTLDRGSLLTALDSSSGSSSDNIFAKKILAYFDQYALLNDGTIANEVTGSDIKGWNSMTNVDKVSKIKEIYANKPELLAKFITENDIIVCDGACKTDNSNIIFMNGQFGSSEDFKVEKKPYTYVDKNGEFQIGESIIYKYKDQIITSNLFGNGIISFDDIDKTKVKGTNHNIFNTKASLSSLFGNAFANSGLDKTNVTLGAVYEDTKTDDVMSVVLVNDANLIKAKRGSAIRNFADKSLVTENARFNFGKIKFGFTASQKQEKNEILKSMTDYKTLLEGKDENLATTNDISFIIPLSSSISVGVLTKGENLDILRLSSNSEGFSLISKNNGFRQTHSSFVSIFEAGKNLRATSFKFNGTYSNFNIITAFNEKENIYTGKNEAKYLGMLESEVKKGDNTSKFSLGVLNEEASIYGSHFAGGMAIEGSTTAFLGFETKQKLSSGFFGLFGFNYGVSFVKEGKVSLIQNFTNIHSSNINAGIGYEGVFGVVAFNYSTGLASHYGNATAFNGKDYKNFSLKSDSVEQNFELSFANRQTQNSNIKLALIHTENVANIQGERQNFIALKLSKKF
jgi:hypothetical protein